MRKKAESQKKILKWVIVAEIIVCYMAVLAVISYVRGPERYTITGQPLLDTSTFTSFAGAAAASDLPMENATPGQAVGWQGEVDLSANERLSVSFQINCPATYAGGTLFVDLYNSDADFDSPAQENAIVLAAGLNEVQCSLDPGINRPEMAFLRLFTLDVAGYEIDDLAVYQETLLPKVPIELWIGAGACFLLLAGTVVARGIVKLHAKGEGK